MARIDDTSEWLEADGLGGFASGTATCRRTRRYHALLLTATTPPTGRMVLVNGLDATVQTPAGEDWLSSQRYAPDVLAPDGVERIEDFRFEPWPHWTFRLGDGTVVEQELFVPRGYSVLAARWRLLNPKGPTTLRVRPLLSGRDYHSLHHENPSFRFDAAAGDGHVSWYPYDGLPQVTAYSNGRYEHGPIWYRSFLYEEERKRGMDCIEDLASPGVISWDLQQDDAVLILAAQGHEGVVLEHGDVADARSAYIAIQDREARRRQGMPVLHRAAEAYIADGRHGKTILAGFPWFTDWGRDAFIALRGLCLASGRLSDARDILVAWAGAVDQGMLPNRFPDRGEEPEYNSVDAALWYIIACHDYMQAMERAGRPVPPRDRQAIVDAIMAILRGYSRGTRYQIHRDDDGLLAAGEPGVQLTWMDVKIGDWVVTPRIGKPVEIEALWLNSLWIGSHLSAEWKPMFEQGKKAFESRFWNAAGECLYDVVDVDHRRGEVDDSFRPNQILAVGGLPQPLLAGERARQVVDAVESRLLTPLGLRSLAPGSPGYAPHYEGGPRERDSVYHQGTVWPWLMGPFVDAWMRTRGNAAQARDEVRQRFLPPLMQHLDEAGLGHASEIADAEPPYTPRGCPFQAWSVGELLRILHVFLAEAAGGARTPTPEPAAAVKPGRAGAAARRE